MPFFSFGGSAHQTCNPGPAIDIEIDTKKVSSNRYLTLISVGESIIRGI
jgi:hypothetical protein